MLIIIVRQTKTKNNGFATMEINYVEMNIRKYKYNFFEIKK